MKINDVNNTMPKMATLQVMKTFTLSCNSQKKKNMDKKINWYQIKQEKRSFLTCVLSDQGDWYSQNKGCMNNPDNNMNSTTT